MKNNLFNIFVALAITFSAYGQEKVYKTHTDDNSKYTNEGNVGLTITNFGTYGHGFSLWPDQPSCEFPLGSGIEHIFDGGLWIGAYKKNSETVPPSLGPYVTTGAVDASSITTRGGGFEFTNDAESVVRERSSLIDSRFYNPNSVSHQDLYSVFTDTSTVYENGEQITDHNPIGVVVRHEAYTWNYPFANFFVIMNYWIKNVSDQYLDSVYVGLWTDTVVRNTNITSPRTGSSFFNKGGNGFKDSLNIGYEFDAAGDVGFTDSYVGVQYLGSSQQVDSAHYVSWQYKNTDDPKYFAPQNDQQRYNKLRGFFTEGYTYNNGTIPSELKAASNRSFMVSAGPFKNISPGDSVNVVFAIVLAKKFGYDDPSLDTEVQKSNLYSNASWALRAYNGEDKNANGVLDPGEDLDSDGEITRYILPTPPTSPKTRVVIKSNSAEIYWDGAAENSVDPISGKKDFEGYRLYRTNTGFDLTEAQDLTGSLVKIAEFDSVGNDIGLNTGFDYVKLEEPAKFDGDDTEYKYRFDVDNLLNGWQYVFTVTAFDEGDEENKVETLESSLLANSKKILPGTEVNKVNTQAKVGVYPNPYYGEAYWDGSSERLRKIYFNNLPARCEIMIYTLAGDVVKKIYHDQESNGADIRWFETYSSDGAQQMSGGEHAWDLVTDSDQAIATGLYLFTVKDLDSDDIRRGKFLIIK